MLAALDAGAAERRGHRVVLDRALAVGELLCEALARIEPSARIELAGSARRRCESVKDLDIVLDNPALLDQVETLELIESATRTGASAARARTHSGMVVELRAVAPEQFGNLLQHLTGSAAHNAALRERAVRDGLHISEYGVLDDATRTTRVCAEETELYALLGLPYIEPELRENRGELEAALAGTLPSLVELGDIRGDLHCHTTASDGRASIEEMALAARERGYEYLAITDHSATHGFGDDVSPEQLRRQIELVREADARIEGIRLLAGSEVNVLPGGELDYEDELLAALDWVIASVHTAFGIDADAMTERVLAAARHPRVDALGHLTGRLIERREPYATGCRRGLRRLRAGGHADRDQREPGPPRPQRGARARGRRRRRRHRDQLRRALAGGLRRAALRRLDGAARLAGSRRDRATRFPGRRSRRSSSGAAERRQQLLCDHAVDARAREALEQRRERGGVVLTRLVKRGPDRAGEVGADQAGIELSARAQAPDSRAASRC